MPTKKKSSAAKRPKSSGPHYTKAYSQYGASMGRRSDLSHNTTDKLHLNRVRLDSGGYDPGGAYWGGGTPLYRVENDEGEQRYLRARDREAAKKEFPKAKWFR